MKKKMGIVILVLAMAMGLLAGCGEKVKEEIPYDYDLAEYVNIADYHDMPYMKNVAEVTDEDVENEINARLQYASVVENSTTGIVEDGDTINIAFAGKIDGELFDGGSSESYDLTVGSTSMIDGFVEGLVGKNIGETVTLDLKFPEEYHNADVAGKPVVFEVTINSKKTITVPEFNDEFVKANSNFETTGEYKANLKDVLLKQKQESMDAAVKDALWEIIVTGSEVIKYPEPEMAQANSAADQMEAEYKSQATLYGLDWPSFLSLFLRTDEEGFAEMKSEYAKNVVLSDMVLHKMARDESVAITQSEFESRAKEILESSSFTEESFKSSYGMTIVEYAEANGWRNSFLLEKVMDKVVEYGHEVSEDEFDAYVSETLGYDEEEEHDHDHDNHDHDDHDHDDHDHDHDDTEESGEGSESEEGEGN